MKMEPKPLHLKTVHKLSAIINRSHTFLHSIAIVALIYYRAFSIFDHENSPTAPPLLPWLAVFAAELLLSFIWLLRQAYLWRPVTRTVFPERLPGDEDLPAIDVFICTADPKKEPPVGVMNTVVSAMALDYPPDRLSVYLSDDGGSAVTLYAIREAWCFAKLWVPFCRKYSTQTLCPEAYFSTVCDHNLSGVIGDFTEDRQKIQRKYEEFKERLIAAGKEGILQDRSVPIDQGRPSVVEVISDDSISMAGPGGADMPLLVYISREKKQSHPHNFKAGALNALIRLSGVISNAPYILVLDCDMYCNDPISARQAMCFHLDPNLSPSLAFVQFPQKFHNVAKNDIYDGEIREIFKILWKGADGLKGPIISGMGFYIKRKALRGTNTQQDDLDLVKLRQSFGLSNEFIESLTRLDYKRPHIGSGDSSNTLLSQNAQFLASCTYEKETQWGQQIGFRYHSLVEDYFTGFMLRCEGWTSIYCDPLRPAFLGSSPINLDDSLVQNTRWSSGLLEVCLSRFCPIVYGLSRMPILDNMCDAFLAFYPLYCIPIWCLATIPQLCLLNGIPLYPKISSSWFTVFLVIFLSECLKYLWDVFHSGGSIQTWWNEWCYWMLKSVTSSSYGSLDVILKLFGIKDISFKPTNKVASDEQVRLYQMGLFDFQTSTMFLVPLVSLVILNMVSFSRGVATALLRRQGWDENFAQVFLSLLILTVNYPIIEGMMLRKDEGSIPLSVTLLSIVFVFTFLLCGSVFLTYA